MFKKILFRLKEFHSWVAVHKDAVSTTFIIFGTIAVLLSSSTQSQIDGDQANLIFDVTNVGVSYSDYAANNTDIMLDRSIASQCQVESSTNPAIKSSCSSSNVLLQGAVSQHDALKENSDNWSKTTTDLFHKLGIEIPSLSHELNIIEMLALLFFVLAMYVNTL